jgi:hypothetical protein
MIQMRRNLVCQIPLAGVAQRQLQEARVYGIQAEEHAISEEAQSQHTALIDPGLYIIIPWSEAEISEVFGLHNKSAQ